LVIVLFVASPASKIHRRSVAILPSALLIEHLCSVPVGRFSFQWVLQPGCRSLMFRQADQGAGAIPQSPELGDLVGWHPFYQNDLGCASNQLATVAERIIIFAAHPQLVQQHRQLSRHRHDGSLLGTLAASFGHLQSPAA
jgi:hypothetical protein